MVVDKIKARELFNTYTAWCNVNNIRSSDQLTETSFAAKIQEQGLKKKRTKEGQYYIGLRLIKKNNITALPPIEQHVPNEEEEYEEVDVTNYF